MHAPVLLAVFSIRPSAASRKTALPCVLLAHRPYRRGLPAPPKRAPVQAPGAWFRDVAFLAGAVPGQFSIPGKRRPARLAVLVSRLQSSRRRFPSFKPAPLSIIVPYARQSDLSLLINHMTPNRGRRSRTAQQGSISRSLPACSSAYERAEGNPAGVAPSGGADDMDEGTQPVHQRTGQVARGAAVGDVPNLGTQS